MSFDGISFFPRGDKIEIDAGTKKIAKKKKKTIWVDVPWIENNKSAHFTVSVSSTREQTAN